jgi:type VI secretion system protein ImpA
MVDLENPAHSLLRWDRLLSPIAGDCPSGSPVRNKPEYDEIREALRPPDTAPGGVWQHDQKPADYNAVIKMASDQLATRSKDLDIAVWLTEALVRQYGIPGLTEGLVLIRELLADFWETVYPVIDEDGDEGFRARPINRLNTAFVSAVLQLPITGDGRTLYDYNTSRSEGTPEEVDQSIKATPAEFYDELRGEVEAAREAIGELQQACNAHFKTGDRPYLEKLLNQMEGLHNTVVALRRAKPASQPAAAPAPKAASTGPAPPAAATEPPPSPVEAATPDRDIFRIATSLRREDAASPVPYMLVRSWAFGALLARGAPVDPGQLHPPSTELRIALRTAIQGEDWWEALEQTETAMQTACGGCWLDIQNYSHTACRRLGFDAAAGAIRGMTAAYLQALPDLMTALMLDGSPVASPDTFAWLRTEILVDAQSARKESLDEVRTVDFEDQLKAFEGKEPDAFDVAESEMNAGRFEEAFRVLAEALQREQSGRGRMQRKLQLAKISMEANQDRIALPILRELFQLIEDRRLDSWEAPELICPPLAMLYRCLEKAEADDNAGDRRRVYERLCAIAPLRALELTSKP